MPVNKITRHKTVSNQCSKDINSIIDYFGKYNIYTISLCKSNCCQTLLDDDNIVNQLAAHINFLENKVKTVSNIKLATIIELLVKNLNNLLRFLHFIIKIDTIVISYIDSIINELELFSKIIAFINKTEDNDINKILIPYILIHFPANIIGLISNTYNVSMELEIVNKKFYHKIIKKPNDCPTQLNNLKENISGLSDLCTHFAEDEITQYGNQLLLQIQSLYMISKNSCNYVVSDLINFINYEIQLLTQNIYDTPQKILATFLMFDTTKSLTIPMQNIGILARKLKNQKIKYGASQKNIFNPNIKIICQC